MARRPSGKPPREQVGQIERERFAHKQPPTRGECQTMVFHRQRHLKPTASGDHHFLDIVTQYQSVFIALEKLGITMNMWTEFEIDYLLHDYEVLWTAHLDENSRKQQHHLVPKILIINFLAGTNFEWLTNSRDGSAYIHECRGNKYRLETIEQMIDHIESDHHVHGLLQEPKWVEPSENLRTFLNTKFPKIVAPHMHPFSNALLEHPTVVATVRHHLDEFRTASFQEQDAFCTHLSSLPLSEGLPTSYTVRDIARLVCLAGHRMRRIRHRMDSGVTIYGLQKSEYAGHDEDISIGNPGELNCVFYKVGTTECFQARWNPFKEAQKYGSDKQPQMQVTYISWPGHVAREPESISLADYRFLTYLSSHEAIFKFLQAEKTKFGDMTKGAQTFYINELQERFPLHIPFTATKKVYCFGCGRTKTRYTDHLRVLVALNAIAGKGFRHLRFDPSNKGMCFQYLTKGEFQGWKPLETNDAILQAAGFE